MNDKMVAGLNERRRRTPLKSLKMKKLRESFVVAGARNQLNYGVLLAAA